MDVFALSSKDTFDKLIKDDRKQTKMSLKQADAAKKRQAVLRRERDQVFLPFLSLCLHYYLFGLCCCPSAIFNWVVPRSS